MKIESVRTIETRRNYEEVMDALYWMDAIVSDVSFDYGTQLSVGTIDYIKKLFDLKILSAAPDQYIASMVTSYIRRKHKIVLYLVGLGALRDVLSGFVIQDKLAQFLAFESDFDPDALLSSRINLVSPNIISMFPNATELVIKTGSPKGRSLPFDVFEFLNVIKYSTLQRIKIQCIWKEEEGTGDNWISKLWQKSQNKLIEEYANENFKISYDKQTMKSFPSIIEVIYTLFAEYLNIVRL